MVAFNFKPRFVSLIESGDKRSTIRSTKRCSPGDNMQLYTGMRTKNCRKIGDAVCTGVAKISISQECPWHLSETSGIVLHKTRLHIQEGFTNPKEFIDFFKNLYGLPYIGYLHSWNYIKRNKHD